MLASNIRNKLRGGSLRVIDVHDLDNKDVELIESLVKRLRARGRATPGGRPGMSGLERSAGSWKGLIDPDELISDLYSRRTVSRPAEVKL